MGFLDKSKDLSKVDLTITLKGVGTHLIKEAKERGAADTVLSFLADIVTSRISTYEELAKNYEKASDATDEWIIKAKRAKRKLENAITELRNATK
jgi:translation initiation factor 2B subunit (eIF-2B alpha/beta/delta family)